MASMMRLGAGRAAPAALLGCALVTSLLLGSFVPLATADVSDTFLTMSLVPYDPAWSCDDLLETCGPSRPTHAGGLGLRALELHYRGHYLRGARFTLEFPADWTIYDVEFCDDITPIQVGGGAGELFELDFGHCRAEGPVRIGRIVFNVRSRGEVYPDNQEVDNCYEGWQETFGGGTTLGLPCEIDPRPGCRFCIGQNTVYPRRIEHVLIRGKWVSDVLTAEILARCIDDYTCTPEVTPCAGVLRSTVGWTTLTDLGGPWHSRRYRVDSELAGYPPGRYRGSITNIDGMCCIGDCAGLDMQIIDEVEGNRQPVARIRPTGAEANPVTFDGTGSFDLDGSPLTYAWDFGDGATSNEPTPTHIFASMGSVTIWLVVSDGVLESTPDSLVLEIIPEQPPTAVRDPGTPAARVVPLGLEVTNPVLPGRSSVRFGVGEPAQLRLDLFALTGRHVATLAEGTYAAGWHSLDWDGTRPSLSSGIFFIRLSDGRGHRVVEKLLLIR